jgi:putative ABC transport system permease protein
VTLFRLFIVRRLLQERGRLAATLAGIALGIGVILAIRMANVSSLQGFRSAVDMTSGRTSLEITTPGSSIDERRLLTLAWLEEYGAVSPVVQGDWVAACGSCRGESLTVLGIDILRDRTFRDYRLVSVSSGRDPGSAQEFLRLLLDPHSVILTEKFARRHRLSCGQPLDVIVGDRVDSFVIRGLLKDEGPARAVDGNFAVMDIAAAQMAFRSIGRLTRIDLRLFEGISVEQAERAIASRLPSGLEAGRPARRGAQIEKMISAFQFNLQALSYIALLVGLFLIYNTVSISVLTRREEIGTLRALGTPRRTVLGLFLLEALLLAAAGCAAGLGFARFLAIGAVQLTAATVKTIYLGLVSAPPAVSADDVALAFAIGIPLALAAAAVPALEASRIAPTAAMRGSDRIETRFRLKLRTVLAPGLLFATGAWLATLGPVHGLPIFGFFSALAIMFGGASLTPVVLFILGRAGARPLGRLFKLQGRLALANLAGSIPRLGISVAALALSLSMMVAIAVMVGSFRATVGYWVGQMLQADLYISPVARSDALSSPGLSTEVESIAARQPSALAVDRFTRLEIPYGGAEVMLAASDFAVRMKYGSLAFKSPADGRAAMLGAIARDAVVVSESFALKYGKGVGDEVELPTPTGPAHFQVAAVFYDYTNDRGTVMMDRSVFARHYGDQPPANVSVYLRPGTDADTVRAAILSEAGNRHRLSVSTNPMLRREILAIFDSTFSITTALELIATVVALLGVAATLVTLNLERRHELTLLRLLGAERGQVRGIIVLEAVLIGFVALGIGLAVGMALSFLLIYVINVQSFGWTIQFHVPARDLVQMSILVLIATALSGFYPARRACALQLVERFADE